MLRKLRGGGGGGPKVGLKNGRGGGPLGSGAKPHPPYNLDVLMLHKISMF